MVSTAERKDQKMESTAEHREKITAAVEVDRRFKDFELEMTPQEAVSFAAIAPEAENLSQSSLSLLVHHLNAAVPPIDFGANHAQTGKPHHSFRIGRERGLRLLKLEIFKGFFQVDFDFMALLEAIHSLGSTAGAQVMIDAGNNSYSVVMRWSRTNS